MIYIETNQVSVDIPLVIEFWALFSVSDVYSSSIFVLS